MNIYEYLQNKFTLIRNERYRYYDISDSTKKILCDIGLPQNPLNFIEFNILGIENIILENKYIVIGNDLGTNICVVNHTNEIVSFDIEYEYPMRFVNSSLENLINFIIIFLSYYNELDNIEENEEEKVISCIKNKFNSIDPKALSNDENWWAIILEQLELDYI